MAYGSEVDTDDNENVTILLEHLMENVSELHSELLGKQNFHMLLDLQDNMLDFGPPIGFNSERYFRLICTTWYMYELKSANEIRCLFCQVRGIQFCD